MQPPLLPLLRKSSANTDSRRTNTKRSSNCSAGANPRCTELGIFSVMWSEHCSYKSSRVHLKRLPTRSKLVVQGPGENAGIIDIGDGWACAFKIESHNHPSFIEPFQGAATGVGGILRDIFTMGARPVAVMDSLRFGPITAQSATNALGRPELAQEPLGHGRRSQRHRLLRKLLRRAEPRRRNQVRSLLLGQSSGECFRARPGSTKIEIFYAKAAGEGNPVIYVGSKTGRDGIHGATMASEEFSEASGAEASERAGWRSVHGKAAARSLPRSHADRRDCRHSGHGCGRPDLLHLRNGRRAVALASKSNWISVPQRETGMTAYEIMLSESQERMLLVARKGPRSRKCSAFSKSGDSMPSRLAE